MNGPRPAVAAAALALLAVVGAAACTAGRGADGSASTAGADVAAGATASSGAATSGAAATGSTMPATTPPASTAATAPPAAMLEGPAVGPVQGVLGGYVYGGAGAAAPWIPAAGLEAVPVNATAELAIALDRGSIAAWSLHVAAEGDTQGTVPDPVAAGQGPAEDGSIRFAAPPAGRWVLQALITYADGMGDGAYYWLLDVTSS